jgi:N-acetylglucosamine-6-phosphate deacetylase
MKGVTRVNAYRIAGAVESGLYNDDLTVEVIADGKHLPGALLKLIYKCKGADKICLITDSMRGAGLPEGSEVLLGSKAQKNFAIIEDGVAKLPDRLSFAGSVATADRLFRTFGELTGVPVTELSKMASATPAKAMGYNDRGVIKAGKLCDLVVLDEGYNVKKVFFRGKAVD